MKIGILGGTFDPVHKAHVALALAALRQLKLSHVYFVLSPNSPFKLDVKKESVDNRLKMLHMALKSYEKFSVGLWETRQKGPNFTFITLAQIKKSKPRDELFLIMGSDTFQSFPDWKKPESIVSLATIVVGKRPKFEDVKIIDKWKDHVIVLKGLFPDVSSTTVRSKLKKGQSKNLPLNPLVKKFIVNGNGY